MIEFTSNHKGIGIIEDFCREQASKGAAKCIKDTRKGDFETGRYINSKFGRQEIADKQELKDKGFNVSVYSQYLLRIRGSAFFTPYMGDIRFWYDNRTKVAGLKISEETLIAIVQSAAIVRLLRDLDLSLGGSKDGKETLDKVATLLTKTMIKIAPDFRSQFTARKK